MRKNRFSLTRRTFVKLAAATGAVGASGAATPFALADQDGQAQPSELGDVKRIRSCCRACGKMECGTWVTVRDGRVVEIVGDDEAITSRGNICSKGQSAMQALYHPDRLKYPLRRTTPKGEDAGWERISWDEALTQAAQGFLQERDKYGPWAYMNLNGTSRLTIGASKSLGKYLGSPNWGSLAGQVCKGPRQTAASLMAWNGAHWIRLIDEPDVFFQWGSNQEVSNYDNACRVTVDSHAKSKKSIVIGPRAQNLGKECDVWLNMRPGTDDFIAMGLLNVICNEMKTYDELFLKRWTDAPYLVVEDMEPSGFTWVHKISDDPYPLNIRTRLLKESDLRDDGKAERFMVWDAASGGLKWHDSETMLWEGEVEYVKPTKTTEVNGGVLAEEEPVPNGIDPALEGSFDVTLKDGRTVKARPVWDVYCDTLREYTPEKVAELAWCDADKLVEIAHIYAEKQGLGGIQYNLALEHAGNSIQTTRMPLIMSAIMGNLDAPGGNCGGGTLYGIYSVNSTYAPMLGAPKTPIETQEAIAGAETFPLMPWFHTLGGAVVCYDRTSANRMVLDGQPYPITNMFTCTGTHFSTCNATINYECYQKLNFHFAIELWHTPTVELADILAPAAHFLECGCVRTSQGSECGLGIQVPIVEPLAEARWDSHATIELTKKMDIPWWPTKKEDAPPWYPEEWLDNPWPDPATMHEIEVLPMVQGRNAPGPHGDQLHVDGWDDFVQQFQEHGWWNLKEISPVGYYRRWLWGWLRTDKLPGFPTPTSKFEIWSTILESYQPGEELPVAREPHESPYSTPELYKDYPIIITTGRRIPVYFHSEHRQLPWCREIVPTPTFQINPATADDLGIERGDWCWIESPRGKVRMVADPFYGIQEGVIETDHDWWFPELSAPKYGWDLCNINCLTNQDSQDPIYGNAALRAFLCKVYKATPENSPFGNPVPCDDDGTPIITDSTDERLKRWLPVYDEEGERQ